LQKRIKETASSLEALTTGALCAAAGIGAVPALQYGGLAWAFLAGPAAVLGYRVLVRMDRRRGHRDDERFESVRRVVALKQEILQSGLPPAERQRLNAVADRLLPTLTNAIVDDAAEKALPRAREQPSTPKALPAAKGQTSDGAA
jgi:hypothetical protein